MSFLKEFLGKLIGVGLDGVVDRLNYCFTSILLVLFATIVGAEQIFGRPISCMIDAEFPGHWVDYVHDFCFTKATYYYELSQDLTAPAPRMEVEYYQWAPYVLLLQALLFCFPHFLWTALEKSADLDLRSTVAQLGNTRSLSKEQRRHGVQTVVEYLADVVELRRSRGSSGLGQWSTVAYLVSKLLAVANILMQVCLLGVIVGRGHGNWPLTVVQGANNGSYWPETGLFPRVTYCDFEVHSLGTVQRKTAQCALTINVLNEKVFAVVFVWLAFLLVPTVLSFAYTAAIVAAPSLRFWFVRRYMAPLRTLSCTPTAKIGHCKADLRLKKFVNQVLGMDGLMLLRFAQANAGHLTASEVARGLFKQWEQHQAQPLAHANDCIDNGSEFNDAEQPFLAQKDQGCSTA